MGVEESGGVGSECGLSPERGRRTSPGGVKAALTEAGRAVWLVVTVDHWREVGGGSGPVANWSGEGNVMECVDLGGEENRTSKKESWCLAEKCTGSPAEAIGSACHGPLLREVGGDCWPDQGRPGARTTT